MKRTKQIQEFNNKDDQTLYKELLGLNHKLNELRFNNSFNKLKNYHEISETRKTIARVKTIINQRITKKMEEAIK